MMRSPTLTICDVCQRRHAVVTLGVVDVCARCAMHRDHRLRDRVHDVVAVLAGMVVNQNDGSGMKP